MQLIRPDPKGASNQEQRFDREWGPSLEFNQLGNEALDRELGSTALEFKVSGRELILSELEGGGGDRSEVKL